MFLKDEEDETLNRADVCHGNLQSTRQQAEGVNGGTAGLGRFDHSSWKRSQARQRSWVFSREGRQLLWFWRGALILGFSTACWGIAGLGFSKDGEPEPDGSMKRGCCAWVQQLEVCAPAHGMVPLYLASPIPCLLPTGPSIQGTVRCKCCLPDGRAPSAPMLVPVPAPALLFWC